jgi:hypothetical protein
MQLSPITPAAPAQFPNFRGEARPGETLTLPGLLIRDLNRNGRVDGGDTVMPDRGRPAEGRHVDVLA